MTDDATANAVATRVAKEAISRLDSYARRVDPAVADMIVHVVTDEQLPTRQRERIALNVDDYKKSAPWLRRVGYRFRDDPRLRGDRPRVWVEPAPDGDDPPSTNSEDGVVSGMLVLRVRGREVSRLFSVGSRPVLLLRPADDDTDLSSMTPPARRLDALVEIPRGRLLELVLDRGPGADEAHIALRRRTDSGHVNITIDGQPLVPGAVRRLGARGSLRFEVAGSRGSTTVTYELLPADDPRTATRLRSGDPTPMRLELEAGPDDVVLSVRPPDLAQDLRHVDFPGDPAAGLGPEHALMLRTEATTERGTDRWHVKLYSCTSQDSARRLRSYLLEQSTIVDTVNAQARRDGDPDPYAILPAYVALEVLPVPDHCNTVLGGPRPAPSEAPSPTFAVDHPASRLPDWFGVPDRPEPENYVVVASPWLDPVMWIDRHRVPHLRGIDDLRPVARALQLCHDNNVLHSDVTPENICWLGQHYVLVDADAVTPITRVRPRSDLRRKPYYISSPMRRFLAGEGARNFDPVEHDRFGFAIVTIAVIAGRTPVRRLLSDQGDGKRRVDDHEQVRTVLTTSFEPGWSPLVDALAKPFRRDALQGLWRPDDWLDQLEAAASSGRQRPPGEAPAGAWLSPYPFATSVREAVFEQEKERGAVHAPADRSEAVRSCLTEALHHRAVEAQRSASLVWSLIPVGTALILLILVLLGR